MRNNVRDGRVFGSVRIRGSQKEERVRIEEMIIIKGRREQREGY